jgi:hypothetical protein
VGLSREIELSWLYVVRSSLKGYEKLVVGLSHRGFEPHDRVVVGLSRGIEPLGLGRGIEFPDFATSIRPRPFYSDLNL